MRLNVLVAYERSGAVRDAFRALGHNAWSNDKEHPLQLNTPYHLQCDARDAILRTPMQVRGIRWDIIIMHPPCTALTTSGNHKYAYGKKFHKDRLAAISYTLSMYELARANAKHVAMENPVGVLPIPFPKYIQPHFFGHHDTKKTGLWLYNLPELIPTDIVKPIGNRIHNLGGRSRALIKAVTYPGVAKAMAEQWSEYVINYKREQE